MRDAVSSEKYDMSCPIGTTQAPDVGLAGEEFARIVSELLRRAADAREERILDCVSSAAAGCTCGEGIPETVVARAWTRELEAGGEDEARFFHFIWEGGVWLAYGLAGGAVRGVYCPSHNSERAERSRAAAFGAGDVVHEIPLAA